jgi:triosephosphate isomerase (TIM)
MARQPIVAANWKMHGTTAVNNELLAQIVAARSQFDGTQVIIFPPAIYLQQVVDLVKDTELGCGAQNVSEQLSGAFTGETSVAMVADLGAEFTLVGHSERRSIFAETNEQVAEKFLKSCQAGLTPVLCIGESLSERQADATMAVVIEQIDAVLQKVGTQTLGQGIIAYEPVWAIGTGETASPEQAQQVHAGIREHLAKVDSDLAEHMRILYGGSVKASNAAELFAMQDIDGGLIGGASLKADEFIQICEATGT